MIKEPIFFERNRVGRVYTGGKLFAGFFGDEPVDNYLPEEWIASNVIAYNKVMLTPKDGVSKLKDSDLYFDDVLKEDAESLLGSRKQLRILVKMLDSAIRLPAQAHPDKEYSRKYLNSEYGKTECWTIIDKRPGAKLYFGFKDGVTKEQFEKAIDDSLHDMDAMERLMVSMEPQIGETYLVPAKTVHAIGKGCLILEVQEPTDFTIQPEHFCGEYQLNDEEMYLGLTREQAVECFQFTKSPDTKMVSKQVVNTPGLVVENIVNSENTDCFVINRIRLHGGKYVADIEDSYGIYIVTDGEGELVGEENPATEGSPVTVNYQRKLTKGDYFFLPASLMGKYKLSGNLEVIECY